MMIFQLTWFREEEINVTWDTQRVEVVTYLLDGSFWYLSRPDTPPVSHHHSCRCYLWNVSEAIRGNKTHPQKKTPLRMIQNL